MWSVHHIIVTDVFKEILCKDFSKMMITILLLSVHKLSLSLSCVILSLAKMNTLINNNKFNKKKVVFIMKATGTGKSHLSVDLATHFQREIINSDKMQVYKGLEIVTNKSTHVEKQGVRYYLLAKMNTFINNNKKKVVFIMGEIGTGKSCLSVDLATHFRGEIINSDKMQVYKGLEIVKNKITHAKKQGVRHYLLAKMNTFINNNKKKVVFIMGAIGTGKSRLSVDLATHFRGEIINSDKMQVYKELEIVTNKITHAENQGVRHYLLGEIELDSDFTAEDFSLKSIVYIEFFLKTQCVPIIVGGYFIWINVEQSVLNSSVETRVEEMLVDEVWQIFILDANYIKGIRLSIGIPEMDKYLREEKNIDEDDESKKMILRASISSIKGNTRILIWNQFDKIQ
ncbi:hypothetical protein H5410_001662 [Solanum commersonii]|uniref:Isopentenyltransferase n=1 Tax=Solanum commersonii TaxID=4109 RepID=A0A9J6AZT6_SOLCO|nr:hypothetical protein H5410_001662 [Solanum commersonii]